MDETTSGMEDTAAMAAAADNVLVFVGTYTDKRPEGIFVYRMATASGALTPVRAMQAGDNPSFLALHPRRRVLYAVNEAGRFNGEPGGGVSAFAFDEQTGDLTPLNQQSSRGGGPCYVSVDPQGAFVFVANYGGGSVAALPIEPDGRLKPASDFVQHTGSSVHPSRQKEPHAHSIVPDPSGRMVYAADLGLDKILIYRLDRQRGNLVPGEPPWATVPAGSGPRHIAFHPNHRFLYVINEINSTVTAFAADLARGGLRPIQTLSTLPDGFRGNNSCADLHAAPSGKFLYGSNRGHDSIVIFAVDGDSGKLRLVGHEPTRGKTPRNFALDPSGTFLLAANQETDNIAIFRVDGRTGRLSFTGHEVKVPRPVCIQILAAPA